MSMDKNAQTEGPAPMPDIPSVEDEDSISERRALRRVQDLWDFVADTRMAIARDNLVDQATVDQRRRTYYEAVRNLWIGLKPYISTIDDEAERHYLLNVDLGTVDIDPPAAVQKPSERTGEGFRLLAGESWPQKEQYSFDGFLDFEQADAWLHAQWAVRIDVDSFTTNSYRQELVEAIQYGQRDTESKIQVQKRRNNDFEEPFIIDKAKLLPRYVIERAFQAEVELMGELGMSTQHEEEREGTMKDKYKQIMGGVDP